MKWINVLAALFTGLFLVAVMAYFSGAFHAPAEVPDRATPAAAGSELLIQEEVGGTYESVPGTVSATDETLVGSRLLATITRIHVRSGDRVEPGDPLVEFDDSAQRSVLEQRQQAAASSTAAFEEAELDRDRAMTLYENGNLPRADYDRALTAHRVRAAELERARRAVAEAQAQLDYTRIVAPISGTIVDRYVEAGDTTVPGQALLRLYNPGRLRVEALLRESLIGQVNQGQEITARIGALDLAVQAVVEEIVPTADPGSRSFVIKALLPAQLDLYPGMFARLEIPTGERQIIRIPVTAVLRSGQLTFVYVLTESGTQRRSVRLGTFQDGQVTVLSGLGPGDRLLVPEG